jgi:hypothetical protein
MIYVTTVYVGTDDWIERAILGAFDDEGAAERSGWEWAMNGGPEQLSPEPHEYAGFEIVECGMRPGASV